MSRPSRPARVYLWIALAAAVLAASFYFDAAVQSWMTARFSLGGEAVMRTVSKWGDAPTHLVVGLTGAAIFCAIGNRRWTLIFAAMVLACVIAGTVNPAVKTLAGRSRPSVKTGVAWNGPTLEQKHRSFPSGHTVLTTAFFSALVLARPWMALAFAPIPLLIVASRLYLNAHHLSDVVFGAMLGFCCALLACRLLRIWFKADAPDAR